MNETEKIEFVKKALKNNGFKVKKELVQAGLSVLESAESCDNMQKELIKQLQCCMEDELKNAMNLKSKDFKCIFNGLNLNNITERYDEAIKNLSEHGIDSYLKNTDEINDFIFDASVYGFTKEEIDSVKDSSNLRQIIRYHIRKNKKSSIPFMDFEQKQYVINKNFDWRIYEIQEKINKINNDARKCVVKPDEFYLMTYDKNSVQSFWNGNKWQNKHYDCPSYFKEKAIEYSNVLNCSILNTKSF